MKRLSRNTKIALASGGLLLAGGIVGAMVSKKSTAAAPPPSGLTPSSAPPPGGVQLINSTSSLNNGWIYFLKLVAPGAATGDVSNAIGQVGFVDPATKGPAIVVQAADGSMTTLALYTGVTGTAIPASTSSLTWASVLGYPPPGVLSV